MDRIERLLRRNRDLLARAAAVIATAAELRLVIAELPREPHQLSNPGHRRLRDVARQPDGWHTVTPRVFTRDVGGMIGFLKSVFDAQGEPRSGTPSQMKIGDSIVMVSDGGGVRKGLPAFLYVYVENTDEAYQRAIDAGAQPIEEPMDMPYGDRRATVEDSWGNTWQIATYRGTSASKL